MLGSLPEEKHFYQDFLDHFAQAGNSKWLATIMTKRSEEENSKLNQRNKEGNTFLHIFAKNHSLENLFKDIAKKGIPSNTVTQEQSDQERKYPWLNECLEIQNNNGHTFLAIAASNNQKTVETDIIGALEWMIEIFGRKFVSKLLEIQDNGGNFLAHLAVRKSLMKLLEFILSITEKAHKIKNKDGYNPLHLAVQTENTLMVKHIVKQKNFKVNIKMRNGETALHLVAQLGKSVMLEDLIESGGDLSVRDTEDGHTPLHDCLQQVYFESRSTEEMCDKFIKIWNTVVERAVQWWCLKHRKAEIPPHGSEPYLKLQWKAVYYLRSCIKNKNGLSVLQFAADRGLTTCVQTMLSTKGVFVIQQTESVEENNHESENVTVHGKSEENKEEIHEVDVTNLCPEYFVKKSELYETHETEKLKEDNRDTCREQRDHELISFLDALAEIKPQHKAGEILESIPMIKLTRLEWKLTQAIHFLWILIHFTLMVLVTNEIATLSNDSEIFSVIILVYAIIITTFHLMVKVTRRGSERIQAKQAVRNSVKRYEKDDIGLMDLILYIPRKVFNKIKIVLLFELFFTGFASAMFIPNLDETNKVWIKGFLLLFGWLIPLFPLTSFSPIYKLIYVLKYILIRDMFPWIIIYFTISIGFATAIKLQFDQLPSNSTCVGDDPNLTGFLHQNGHTLFELVIMTSGLDTDLKNVRTLECLFESETKVFS